MRRDILEIDEAGANGAKSGRRWLGLGDVEAVRLLLSGESVVDWQRLAFRDLDDVDRFLGTHLLDATGAIQVEQQLLLDGASSHPVLGERRAAHGDGRAADHQHRLAARLDVGELPRDDIRVNVAVGDVPPHGAVQPTPRELLVDTCQQFL